MVRWGVSLDVLLDDDVVGQVVGMRRVLDVLFRFFEELIQLVRQIRAEGTLGFEQALEDVNGVADGGGLLEQYGVMAAPDGSAPPPVAGVALGRAPGPAAGR